MRNRISTILFLCFFVALGACKARVYVGPYLVMDSEGRRVVRVQSSHKSLELEYEPEGGRAVSVSMKRVNKDFHEVPLPHEATRYRIRYDERKTTWHDLPPVSVDGVQRIVAYGDPRIGRGNPVARTRLDDRMAKEKPSLVITSGDLVAWGNREGLWRDLLGSLKQFVASVPYVAAIGNHDESSEHLFRKFFRSDSDENYMSMPLGSGKLILLDSNDVQERGNEQYQFLEKELAAAHDAWPLIVAFHHPPYNFGHHPPREDLIAAWVPLFQKYAVDLVILGHDHDYQRIGPIGGVLYIVTGGGGAPLVRVPGHTDPRLKAFAEVNNYVVLDIKENGMTGVAKDENGDVIDRFSVSR